MGITETVYTTPQNEDSSLAQAYITGLTDTASFNIYAVRYVPNSLDPKIAAPGDTIDFSAYYSNPGTDSVYLDTTGTIFSFTDGTYTASSNLSSPLFLEPRSDSTRLFFDNTIIDNDFASGNFTPGVAFSATSRGQNIFGTLNMDPGELSMAPLDIISISITDPATKTVVQGDTLRRIEMVVRNNSLNQINNLTPVLTFAPPLASDPILDPANPDSIPGNTQITLILAAPIPIDASLDTYMVDGSVSGNLAVNGNPVFDTGANSTDTFDIISGASVTLITYSPQTVSANQDVAFEVSVSNSGVASVILNQIQTTFEFGAQNFTLDGDQVVSPDTTSLLRFASSTVGLSSGRYQGTLILVGTENGVPYQDTLFTGISDSLTVQDGTVLAVSSITLSDSVVSQGESGQTLYVRVLNTGESQARILSADSIQFSYNSTYSFSRTSGQSFPFTLNGGDSTLFVYNVDVGPSAVAGQDTFRATIGYEDVNSGVSYTASDPGVYDNWQVISDVSLNIVSLTATDTRVTQGQSGLAVSLEISNTGETGAVVGSADSIGITFLWTKCADRCGEQHQQRLS
jgi:hypothetical protein